MNDLSTPRPWQVNSHDTGRYAADISAVLGRNESGITTIRTIATILTYGGREEGNANAALIVEAVNQHVDLHDRFRMIRHILDVPLHKLDDAEFLRACVMNARAQAKCAINGEPLSNVEQAFMRGFVK